MNISYFFKPTISFKVSKSLWYDYTAKDEQAYHLFSVQLREKDDIVGVLIICLGLSCIFTTPFLSDMLLKFLKEDE